MSDTIVASPAFAASTQEVVIKTPNDQTGVSVDLPNRFAEMVGQPMSEYMAKIIFTHVAGQFRNNHTANAKAREARYAKDAKPEDAPWGVDQYLEAWSSFNPNVGGADRQSSTDKLKYEAAKRVWVQLIAEHNEAIKTGGTPVLKSTKLEYVAPRPVKKRDVSTTAHDAAVQEWQDKQTGIYDALLRSPTYADRIQTMLEVLTAEAGKAKAEADGEAASADLLG